MNQQEIEAFVRGIKAGEFSDILLRRFYVENIATMLNTWKQLAALARPVLLEDFYSNVATCDWCMKLLWKANLQIDNEHGWGTIRVCQACAPAIWCENCGCFYSKNQTSKHKHPQPPPGCINPHSSANPHGTHSPDGLIQSYTAKIEPILFQVSNSVNPNKTNLPCYGIELEVERKPNFPADLHQRILENFPENYIMLKRDGSLGDGGMGDQWSGAKGFEIVTAPCTFEFATYTNHWKRFFATFKDYLEYDPGTTGLHIHIGVSAFTQLEVAKYWQFVNAQENRKFLSWLAARELVPSKNHHDEGNYAMLRPHEKMTRLLQRTHDSRCPKNPHNIQADASWITYDSYWRDDWGNPIITEVRHPKAKKKNPPCQCVAMRFPYHRHEAFNINTGLPTVEMRIFKGIMDEEFFFSCLEFTDAMVTFVKNVSKDDMLWDVFLNWFSKDMRRSYPHLAHRIKEATESNLIADFWVKDIVFYDNKKKLTTHPYANSLAWEEIVHLAGLQPTPIASPYYASVTATEMETEFEEPGFVEDDDSDEF